MEYLQVSSSLVISEWFSFSLFMYFIFKKAHSVVAAVQLKEFPKSTVLGSLGPDLVQRQVDSRSLGEFGALGGRDTAAGRGGFGSEEDLATQ